MLLWQGRACTRTLSRLQMPTVIKKGMESAKGMQELKL